MHMQKVTLSGKTVYRFMLFFRENGEGGDD